MGCDGGTIPKRGELVRKKKKPEQKDRNSELAFKWKHCAISQEALVKPIVACELGRLYNKESVLELLLDRSKFEAASQFDHLRGLKDIKELNLTENPERRPRDAEKGDAFIDPSISDFICPVVGLEMSGIYKFCFLWSCGCAVSERALREVKSETCHKCGKKFTEEDVVMLNGTEEELAEMRAKMENRRAQMKASRKAKKAEKHKLTDTSEVPSKKVSKDPVASSSSGSSSSPSPPPTTTDPTDGTTKSETSNGRGKVGSKKGACGKTSASKIVEESKGKGTVSIQKDPKTSQTFKSLFTTCESAKSQKQAHWVTYNPLYF